MVRRQAVRRPKLFALEPSVHALPDPGDSDHKDRVDGRYTPACRDMAEPTFPIGMLGEYGNSVKFVTARIERLIIDNWFGLRLRFERPSNATLPRKPFDSD